MEFVKYISKKYDVPENIIISAIKVKPDVYISDQTLIELCTQNNYPISSPENDPTVYGIFVAYKLAGLGRLFIAIKSKYFNLAQFNDADKVWDLYVNTTFDSLDVKRLYIDNTRFEFLTYEGSGKSLSFVLEKNPPTTGDYTSVRDLSVFINGELYNISKMYIDEKGYVFLWTTQQYMG